MHHMGRLTDWQTDTYENITFLKLRSKSVKIYDFGNSEMKNSPPLKNTFTSMSIKNLFGDEADYFYVHF